MKAIIMFSTTAVCIALVTVSLRNLSTHKSENTITDYARIGIEAGLNAAMVRGKPTNRKELDDARDYARTLVEKMYPQIKFKWPALQKHPEQNKRIAYE